MSSIKQEYESACGALKALLNPSASLSTTSSKQLSALEGSSHQSNLVKLFQVLDSPLFSRLVALQDSLSHVHDISRYHIVDEDSFDFDICSGRLIQQTPTEGSVGDISEQDPLLFQDTTSSFTSVLRGISGADPSVTSGCCGVAEAIERAAHGRATETVVLSKVENASLGFGVVGLRSEHRGELGIYVQEIQPGGIADRDGHLQVDDQILAINGQLLDSAISHEQAITILQHARGRIELVVARGDVPTNIRTVVSYRAHVGTEGVKSNDRVGKEGDVVIGGKKEGALSHVEHTSAITTVAAASADLSTDWTQLEVINLVNDGSGLGFGIIGGKNLGVVVKTILPGGVADRDGHLRSGDHLLQIGDINVRGMGSELVASVLRQSGAHVRLIVARAVHEPPPTEDYLAYASIIPTDQLGEHIVQLNSILSGSPMGYSGAEGLLGGRHDLLAAKMHQTAFDDDDEDGNSSEQQHLLEPDMKQFEVTLVKDNVHGLGITIAGYVSDRSAVIMGGSADDLSGIFVRSITSGSAAALDGRIHIHDQIIAVDGRSLEGSTNQQAVEVLRNTAPIVHLKLARYLSGPKYEQLLRYSTDRGNKGGILSGGAYSASNTSIHLIAIDDYGGELIKEVEDLIVAKWTDILGDGYDIIVAQVCKFKEGGGLGISLEGTVDVENGVEVHPHHYIRSVITDGPVGVNGRLHSGDELLEVNGVRLLGVNHVEVVLILKDLPRQVRIVCGRRKRTNSSLTVTPVSTPISTSTRPHLTSPSYPSSLPPRTTPSPVAHPLPIFPSSPTLFASGSPPTSLTCLVPVSRPSSTSPSSLGPLSHPLPSPTPVLPLPLSHSSSSLDKTPVALDPLLDTPSPPVFLGTIPLFPTSSISTPSVSTPSPSIPDSLKHKVGAAPGSHGASGRLRTNSHEPLAGLAIWSTDLVVIELNKGEKGLGFSILDYQDPINHDETVIVIRSLVPGGVAQLDGRLAPGDRLLFVNDVHLEKGACLDDAVQALKNTSPGTVVLGVAKPLPLLPDPSMESDNEDARMVSVVTNKVNNNLSAPPYSSSPFLYPHEVPPPVLLPSEVDQLLNVQTTLITLQDDDTVDDPTLTQITLTQQPCPQ